MNEWSCQDCGGSGYDSGSLNSVPDECRGCGGTGVEPSDYDDTNDIECREERAQLMAAWA